ncbi:class I adenylate cyclase [Agaribacterium sp. ZY112]|uniref:class I adenylate cyclase n=1 Tax=Agaribacterium sp. ZY112 TaxID=3233574 RepID=UPI0035264A41
MKQHPIQPEPIQDGFDRQNLNTLRKRFLAVNLARLERLNSALNEHQQSIVRVLPLLFHCNHPMLPGFCGHKCPSKVSDYTPKSSDLRAAKSIARSFTLQNSPYQNADINAIFLMGSVGTIAQTSSSDIDVWLCFQDKLSNKQQKQLSEKCERISSWAKQQGLDLHIFPMNAHAFKQGQLSSMDLESSGSTQRLLLLDEFYRSSIYLCGHIPLWWYVPNASENNYEEHCQRLQQRRFLPPQAVIDFGSAAHIPNNEFVGAAIWQLYKAIESPYKSVLKLILLEVYVHDWPKMHSLAADFKALIYKGELDIDKLDNYLLMYQRIEHYLLTQKQNDRLELTRRCFYFKAGRALSKINQRSKTRPWQHKQLQHLIEQWGWDKATISKLDQRRQWKSLEVCAERKQLVDQLNVAYQNLLNFAQYSQSDIQIDAHDLRVLGNKLQAAFEQRAGKIDWINPNISNDISENQLYIAREAAQTWSLRNERGQEELHQALSLNEILLWACYNGIYTESTQVSATVKLGISQQRLSHSCRTILRWLPKQQLAEHKQFEQNQHCRRLLLLINSESPEQKSYSQNHTTESADRLIQNLSVISLNSWSELQIRHFEGKHSLLDALLYCLHHSELGTKGGYIPSLELHCMHGQLKSVIEQHSRQCLQDLFSYLKNKAYKPVRYVLALGGQWQLIHIDKGKIECLRFSNKDKLILALSAQQQQWSALHFDRNSFDHSPLPLIASKLRRNCIQVFYRHFDIGSQCYIADEKGSIVHISLNQGPKQKRLRALQHFLRACIYRQSQRNPELLSDFGVCPVYLFRIQEDDQGRFSLRKRQLEQSNNDAQYELKAVARLQNNSIHYDFYLNEQLIRANRKNNSITHIKQSICKLSKYSPTHDLQLSDLDLGLVCEHLALDGELQLSHYLKQKQIIESKLNQ